MKDRDLKRMSEVSLSDENWSMPITDSRTLMKCQVFNRSHDAEVNKDGLYKPYSFLGRAPSTSRLGKVFGSSRTSRYIKRIPNKALPIPMIATMPAASGVRL